MIHLKCFSNSGNSYLNSKPLVVPEVDIVLLYKKYISSFKLRRNKVMCNIKISTLIKIKITLTQEFYVKIL
jgi:hypothetical protein